MLKCLAERLYRDATCNRDRCLDAEMLPPGYRVFSRKDRTKHGGGVLILGLEMLLIDTLKLEKHYAPCVSEVIGLKKPRVLHLRSIYSKPPHCTDVVRFVVSNSRIR